MSLVLNGNGDITEDNLRIVANISDADPSTKAEMQAASALTIKPHTTNSTNMNISSLSNGDGMGIQVTNSSATANWDIGLNPFGGKVGIGMGSTNPSQLLHVNGETRSTTMILGDSAAGNVATNSQLHIKTGGTPAIMLEDSTGSNLNMSLNVAEGTGFWIQDRGTSPSNTGTGRFNIDTSGRVGINCGTTVGANHAALTVKSVGTGVASSHGICVRNRTGISDGARTYYNVYHTNTQTGGNTYHHIKTSIATGGYIMFRIDVRGYNYGNSSNLDMSSVGYAYSSNSLIATNNYTHSGTGSIASYIASDGKVCFRINVGTSGYYAGFHLDAIFNNGTGNTHDFEVLGGTWTSSSANQY